MNSLYTKGPSNIPTGFTKPTKSFTKHVWLSVIGLLFFIGLYFLLTIWFGKIAYNLFTDGGNGTGFFWKIVLGVGFTFLSLFMLKSLFFLNKKAEKNSLHKYLSQEEEPVLFDYLYKLADEAGAPRPHKVFLTDRVNASVSYDISLINLLFPSKKNLEIGLGAVNILSLGELKAVIAHEFGHFAQRSMLLGRYVYVTQKITARIVGKRDYFDTFLAGVSSFDLRVAWIGWILSILVWAIRSLIETCFNAVMIAERALSREMEFQADLVAVSLTGSDALIHALYKLQIADEAYNNAIQITNSELSAHKAVADLYVLQSNYIEKMRQILDDPIYGISPEVPSFDAASHRIFTTKKHNPPEMWATHPTDNDRENNAKKTYIDADIDNRSSWDLFSNPKELRTQMTASLIQTAKTEIKSTNTDEESIAKQNKLNFDWSFLAPKYHSAFFGRYPFTNLNSVDDIYTDMFSSDIEKTFKELYPKELASKTNQLKEILEEKEALLISQNEVVTSEKRILYHRGEQIKRSDIPDILENLKVLEKEIRDEVTAHDKKCRNVHHKAAKNLGNGWDVQLKNLHKILHYTEHTVTNIEDCEGKFHNILTMALADGRVSDKELTEIITIGSEYYHIIRRAFNQAETMRLDSNLLTKLNVLTFFYLFEEFKFTPPARDNIDDWIQNVDGWANVAKNASMKLRNVALEELLHTEDRVKQAYLNNQTLENASNDKVTLVDEYAVLTPGMERTRRRKLDFWSRFFIGDGLFHSISKFAVSGVILFAALYFGTRSYINTMYVYNGLSIPIIVTYEKGAVDVAPNNYEIIDVNYDEEYHFKAMTEDEKAIDSVQSDFSKNSATYIYNIANSGLLIQSPIYYGDKTKIPKNEYVKTDKWIGTDADYVLKKAPETISVSSSSSGVTKVEFQAYSDMNPLALLSNLADDSQNEELITSHAIWDDKNALYTMTWLNLAGITENPTKIFKKRLENNPMDVMTLRELYDNSDSIQKLKMTKEFVDISQKNKTDPNYYYLATRTIENEKQKDEAFIKGYEKWKFHPWLAFAAGYSYAQTEQWEKAYNALLIASKKKPSLGNAIAQDVERIRRFLSATSSTKISSVPIVTSGIVTYYINLEKGISEQGISDPYYAYYLLSQGETLKAYKFSKRNTALHPFALRHIAVSKYATNQIINEALALSAAEGINEFTAFSALGLAIQKQVPYDTYLTYLQEYIDVRVVENFIRNVKAGNYKKAESIIATLDINFTMKTNFYTLGNIIAKDKAPKMWKEKMKTLLYIDERPFLF